MARPRGRTKTARLTVNLDDQAYTTLCAMARSEDVSVAWIVRRAVNDLITAYAASTAQPELPLPRSAVKLPELSQNKAVSKIGRA